MDILKVKARVDKLAAKILKKDGSYRKDATDPDIQRYEELSSMMEIRSDELNQATRPKPEARPAPAAGSITEKAMEDPNFAWDVR